MGLTNNQNGIDTSKLDLMAAALRSSLLGFNGLKGARSANVDVESYFRNNTLDVSERPLTDEDVVSISLRTNGGYVAKFVRLGDLRDFLLGTSATV